jgi:hypothetical protein
MTKHRYQSLTLELQTHIQFLGDPFPVSSTKELNFGDVIRFWYKTKETNKTRERLVFVLNPEYEDKLHGLDMAYVSHNDLVLRVVSEMYHVDDPQKLYALVSFQDLIEHTDSYRTYIIHNMNYMERMSYQLHHGN